MQVCDGILTAGQITAGQARGQCEDCRYCCHGGYALSRCCATGARPRSYCTTQIQDRAGGVRVTELGGAVLISPYSTTAVMFAGVLSSDCADTEWIGMSVQAPDATNGSVANAWCTEPASARYIPLYTLLLYILPHHSCSVQCIQLGRHEHTRPPGGAAGIRTLAGHRAGRTWQI